ncbi:MAG: type II toxin-antitoxin system VapB family antitoxin [Sulfuricurvum sp.]|jgi:antitoxin VapB|nr:type II toxin-antitoxin system VapB family antitoxin [Sulfuricurvum sp.]
MTARAKLFQNGQSQAVRLPKEYRFDNEKEVDITKLGEYVILSPHTQDRWAVMRKALESFSDDFSLSREELPIDKRDELFT